MWTREWLFVLCENLYGLRCWRLRKFGQNFPREALDGSQFWHIAGKVRAVSLSYAEGKNILSAFFFKKFLWPAPAGIRILSLFHLRSGKRLLLTKIWRNHEVVRRRQVFSKGSIIFCILDTSSIQNGGVVPGECRKSSAFRPLRMPTSPTGIEKFLGILSSFLAMVR